MMKDAESKGVKYRETVNQRQTARVKRDREISEEQSREWDWNTRRREYGEDRIQRRKRRKGGERFSVGFFSDVERSNLESLRCYRWQRHSKIHHYWGDKVTWWLWNRTESPLEKQRPDVAFIFYLFFLSLMFWDFFFQFNYSVKLINRYDCSV